MQTNIELITTADGSHTLLNKALNETYHSVHGALQESRHVFIKNGLDYYIEKFPCLNPNILEVGFGTGLNALLTMEYALSSPQAIYYCSLEAYPLADEIIHQLNYSEVASIKDAQLYFAQLHNTPWEIPINLLPGFTLEKRNVQLQTAMLQESQFDIIFFDAFAPSRQPELWELPILEKIEACLKPGGIFVTYCAKGQLKRDLKSLGFTVETLAGPPGKKEMVRAEKSL